MSHELRTPLAAVYGAAMTLRRDELELDEETRRGLLAIISDQSDRLTGIVNDILLASRLDSGSTTLAAERLDAAELAAGVIEAAQVIRRRTSGSS